MTNSTEPSRDGRAGEESAVPADRIDGCPDRSVEREADVFAALGSETRYRLLLLLSVADGEVPVRALESRLAVGQSSVSQALTRLRKAKLVTRRTDGRWRYYQLTPLAERLLETIDDRP